ncbi:MAG TPA: divalent cation transporter [Candidatus Thermoplasmatota archaeon]|nr:divalent cation transporter [Candidatus Thermoplasmatota archaeon]
MDAKLASALLFAALSGAMIPLGGLLGLRLRGLPKSALRFTIALGGGALLGAVALVLLPDGIERTSAWLAPALFATGGVLFMILDFAIERAGGHLAQFLSLALDAIPESLAIGAVAATGGGAGMYLALLVGVQNAPEGFNAVRELTRAGLSGAKAVGALAFVALLNPVGAYVGFVFLAGAPAVLGAVFLVAAGGITYLLFHDIAPQAHPEGHWIPTLGAILGFAIAIVGQQLGGGA